MEFDELSHRVIGCALEVHKRLGPGLLESAYQQCLAYELSLNKVRFQTEVSLPVEYREIKLDCGYRLDLLIEDLLIVELKSVSQLEGIHSAQLLTYMRLARIPLGLLINFNVERLKEGIKRFVLFVVTDEGEPRRARRTRRMEVGIAGVVKGGQRVWDRTDRTARGGLHGVRADCRRGGGAYRRTFRAAGAREQSEPEAVSRLSRGGFDPRGDLPAVRMPLAPDTADVSLAAISAGFRE